MAKKKKKKRNLDVASPYRIEYLLNTEPPKISVLPTVKEIDSTTLEKQRWHKIMSDENIKYIISGDIIHDKTCKKVKDFNLKDIKTSNEYIDNKKKCPHCEIMSWIHIADSRGDEEAYMKFFRRINLKFKHFKRLIVNKNIKTYLFMDVLTIKINDDIWKIKACDDSKKSVDLIKNNHVIENDIKKITDGFSVYKKSINSVSAFRCIENYNCNKVIIKKFDLLEKLEIKKDDIKLFFKKIICRIKPRNIYFVDGDNTPVERLLGIDQLGKYDEVRIFCARNTSYFKFKERRDELCERTNCIIKFIPIEPGNNAVDFAIALDAYRQTLKTQKRGKIYLVSKDKHFDVIKKQLKKMREKKIEIRRIENIKGTLYV